MKPPDIIFLTVSFEDQVMKNDEVFLYFSQMEDLRLERKFVCQSLATIKRRGSRLGPSELPSSPSSGSCPALAREPSAAWTTRRRRGGPSRSSPGTGQILSGGRWPTSFCLLEPLPGVSRSSRRWTTLCKRWHLNQRSK